MSHGHERLFYRITLNQRIQHNIIMFTFLLVVLTGYCLKFHGAAWTYPLIKTFGGVYMAGRIHRAAGVVMVGNFLYIFIYVIWTTIQKIAVVFREQPPRGFKDGLLKVIKVFYGLPMIPDANDGRNIVDFVRYIFFLSDKPPQYGKFQWKEKFDYLAVFWGTVVFAITGPMMWWPSFFVKIGIPAWTLNVALIIHSDEALLAAGVIFIWHMYNVVLMPEKFPMYQTILTGCVTEHTMMEEYPSEYKRIMIEEGDESPAIVRKDE